MELATRRQEQVEVLADGKYEMRRYECLLPKQASELIGRHLVAVESGHTPPNSRLIYQEIRDQRAWRAELQKSYRRFEQWQVATVILGLAFEVAHGIVVFAMPTEISSIAPVGGSALMGGGACAAALRYLAREKANKLAAIEETTKDLTKCRVAVDKAA